MSTAVDPAPRPQQAYDVFVSYASADKLRVVPIVAALRGIGLNIWLDQDQIDGFFGAEITKAIGKSKAILFFASPAAFASDNTLTELTLARNKKKAIVPVFLEMVQAPEGFEYFLALPQYVNTVTLPEDRWLPEICKKLEAWGVEIPERDQTADAQPLPTSAVLQQAERILGSSAPAFIGAHPLTPYLIDRRTQEHEIKDALALHCEGYARRPIVFFAYGRQEQALNEYVDRLHQFTLPRALASMRSHGYRDIVRRMDMPWLDQDWASNPERTRNWLKNELLDRQGLGGSDWPVQFAAELGKFDAVPIVCYHLHWEDWNDSHLRTLKAWVLEWATMPDLPLGCPIVVVIAVQEHVAEGRPRFPFMRPPKAAGAELGKFGALTSSKLLIVPLTPLGNVRLGDVDQWIRDVVKPRDPSAMIQRFHDVLDDPALFGADGVPMSGFVERARKSGALAVLMNESP